MIDKLGELLKTAEEFEFANKTKKSSDTESQTMCISVVWLGLYLRREFVYHEAVFESLGIPQASKSDLDETKQHQRYEITLRGEPICINEYCTHIASK